MSTYISLEVRFPSNKEAQQFSGCLYREGYLNKTLSGDKVSVTLPSHGDKAVVLEMVGKCGGTIIEEHTEDDN